MVYNILQGDVTEQLANLPNDSIDGVLTDPPYALGFMGKAWDNCLPDSKVWQEVLRVCKPGAYLLAFGGPRTFHRLAVNIEDGGWTIKDTICWLYALGMSKGVDISKAIDKHLGATRQIIGDKIEAGLWNGPKYKNQSVCYGDPGGQAITAPATPEAKRWEGYNTQLKPSYEPVVVAQKPIAMQ